MTEEEYFRKNYPDVCWGDRPLSPYWDYFQDGVEFGERQNKEQLDLLSKHILELQADKGKLIDENKDLKETIDKLREQLALRYDLEDKVAELEAQIEKMKCCYNCSKDCGSIDRRICFENKMKDWELKE